MSRQDPIWSRAERVIIEKLYPQDVPLEEILTKCAEVWSREKSLGQLRNIVRKLKLFRATPYGRRVKNPVSPRSTRPKPKPKPKPDSVEDWIARHGVTLCPPAAVAPTTATFRAGERAVIRAHDDMIEERYWQGGLKNPNRRRLASLRASG